MRSPQYHFPPIIVLFTIHLYFPQELEIWALEAPPARAAGVILILPPCAGHRARIKFFPEPSRTGRRGEFLPFFRDPPAPAAAGDLFFAFFRYPPQVSGAGVILNF